MKKIIFEVSEEMMELATEPPIPAISMIPKWYKNMDVLHGSRRIKIDDEGVSNKTAKACVPLKDAMTAGYYILSNSDVIVSDTDEGKAVTWTAQTKAVDLHGAWQIDGMPAPEGFVPKPFKWINTMTITTPKGYSCLFTHPLHRPDLPFYSLPGIVDTDSFNLPVNFPFFVKENFTGIIPARTPIAQVIPIKRESWQSEFSIPENYTKYRQRAVRLSKNLLGSYSKYFWTKKVYK